MVLSGHAGQRSDPGRGRIGWGANAMPHEVQNFAASGFRAKQAGQTGPDGCGRRSIAAWQ
jgi:hypothetical protein